MIQFETIQIEPKHLKLDPQNPRFYVSGNVSQPEVIRQLLEFEDVKPLARRIASEGLRPGERLIAIREGGETVVVEGNRRLCAVKLLIEPTLVPKEYSVGFPQPTAEVANSLDTISVDLLPDRVTAEPLITRRHTTTDVRNWGVLQKIRRTHRYWMQLKSLEHVASILSFETSPMARVPGAPFVSRGRVLSGNGRRICFSF